MRRRQSTAVGGHLGEKRGRAVVVNHSGRDVGEYSGEACEAAVTRSGHLGGEAAAVTYNRHLSVGRSARLGLG